MTPATALALALLTPTAAPDPAAPDVKQTAAKGLKWLAEKQNADGTWSGANGNSLRATVTAYAGLALLMHGSTLQDGPYAAHLRKAVAWFEKGAQPNGLLVPANDPTESGRYMQSHCAALLFLASAHDADGDETRRTRVAKVLVAAVKFATDAQTRAGGWGLVARDGRNDETFSTAFMVQALLAAERAGVAVPRAVFERAAKYIADATTREGGVGFSPVPAEFAQGNAQQLPTSAGAAVLLTFSRKPPPLAKWIAYTRRTLPAVPQPAAVRPDQVSSDVLQHHLAAARLAHALGETGHRALAPDARETDLLRWSQYRERLFPFLKGTQAENGSWADPYVGPAYSTALALIALQLDNEYVPAFSR